MSRERGRGGVWESERDEGRTHSAFQNITWENVIENHAFCWIQTIERGGESMVVGTIALLEMQCNPVLKTIEVSTHPDSTTCTLNMCLCLTEYSRTKITQTSCTVSKLCDATFAENQYLFLLFSCGHFSC